MRRAGLQVELSVTRAERAVDDTIGRSAYRIVHEALTNTIKHAGLEPARVTVAYRPDDVVLEIADDGTGQGLAGMRERVRLLSGELEAHSANVRGFVVRARIPT